jgi:hypothetical protein
MRMGRCGSALALCGAVFLPAGDAITDGFASGHRSSRSAFAASPAGALPGTFAQHGWLASTTRLDSRTCVCGRAPTARRSQLPLHMAVEPQKVDSEWVSGSKTLKATDYYKPLVEGDILESDNKQRAIVAGSYLLLAGVVVKGCLLLPPLSAAVIAQVCLSVFVGYEFADIGSGVYHWSMDNYGTKNTPIFGTQIEAFQGHHELPWTITYRQVCNNIYKICQATAPFCLAGLVVIDNPFVLIWMATAICFINLSQELHKWSHQGREQTAGWINALQDWNIIVSRKGHLAHHKPPFEGNYCIVSGHCNPIADRLGLFRALEKVVLALTGNEARCNTNERLLEDKVVELGIKRASPPVAREKV